MIPKLIHYCWFGNKPKPKKVIQNIQTWRHFFPEYKIIEWNEHNTNVLENQYVREAYKQKKWAFVSDFVRMKVLFVNGGIYFDTDVEVIKKFPDSILRLNAFSGFESGSLLVSPGLIFACHSHNKVVQRIITSYERTSFKSSDVLRGQTINQRVTKLLEKDGLEMKDELQKVDGITIFPSDFFCGYDPVSRRVRVNSNTLSVHHYDASWWPWYKKMKFNLGTIKRRMQLVLKHW